MENSSTNSLAPSFRASSRPIPLSDEFYLRPCLRVARDLLGKALVRKCGSKILSAEIVEVEAYLGDKDPASHAYRRRTPRNRVMFERGGACYVYLSYGMCFCMNVVTGAEGQGEAVLLRAAAPLDGEKTMRENRGLGMDADSKMIASGPGKLCQALGVDLGFYGKRFDSSSLQIVDLGIRYSASEILRGPRIGISVAKELPYRFGVRGSKHLSRKF